MLLTAFVTAFVLQPSAREFLQHILLIAFVTAFVLQLLAREFCQHILLAAFITAFVSQSSVRSLVRVSVVSNLQLLAPEHWQLRH